jgi:hypothetical protein
MVAGDDLEVDAGSAGPVMMAVGSRDGIRRRIGVKQAKIISGRAVRLLDRPHHRLYQRL